ncbi:MAG: GAF domain-containing protein [bacterium]
MNTIHTSILLVEDEALIALSEQSLLKKYSYVIDIVHSGEEAVEYIRNNDVDLILMDIDLGKGLDGTQAAEIILQEKEIPILFLSSHADHETVEKTEKITSYGYVVKGCDAAILDASIKMAMRLHKSKTIEQKEKSAAEESERRYTYIFQNMAQGAFLQQADGTLIDVNNALLTILGLTKDEFLGRTSNHPEWTVIDSDENPLPPENHPSMVCLKTGKPVYNFTLAVFNHVEQQFHWFKVNAIPQFQTGMDKPYQVFVTLHDITDLRKTEEELQNTLNATTDGIWTWNFETDTLYFSPRYYAMLGYADNEFSPTYESWTNLIHPDDLEDALTVANEYLKTKPDYYENTFRLKKKDGSYSWLCSRAKVVKRDKKGNAVYMIGSHNDITKQKETEELHRKNLQELDEKRTEFNKKINAFTSISSLKNAETKTICDYILDTIVSLTGSAYGFYGFLDDDESILTIHSWSGNAMKDCNIVNKPMEFPISNAGIWAEAVRKRKPFILNDYNTPHSAKRGMPEGHVPLKNICVIPGFTGDKMSTLAAVANREKPYGKDDIDEVSSFLTAIQAISDSTRFEYALFENTVLTNSLFQAAKSILEKENFEQSARNIFDFCRTLTRAQSGYVALLSEDGSENELVFLESGGLACTVDENLPMPVRGLRAQAYKTNKTVYHNDFMNSEWVKFIPPGHVLLKNVLFAPLNLEGKTVGIMGLANKPDFFSTKDAHIAEVFGDLAAIALRNSVALKSLKEKNIENKKLAEQKQTLLKEMQHRAKNSFSLIQSMVNLEVNNSNHPEAVSSLNKIKSRIHAITEMYDLLYRTDSITEVKLDQYITRLISTIPKNFIDIDASQIRATTKIPVKTAIPVGLITVELITNALKHAFPKGKTGTIAVSLHNQGEKTVLEIRDDGIGIQEPSETVKTKGLSLIRSLTTQIHGSLTIEQDNGTKCILVF